MGIIGLGPKELERVVRKATRHKAPAHPKPTGVFARPPLSNPLRTQVHRQHSKVRRAEAKLPPESGLKRFPTLTKYTPKQRDTIVREQGAAVRKIEKRTGQRLNPNLRSREERRQLHKLEGARRTKSNLPPSTAAERAALTHGSLPGNVPAQKPVFEKHGGGLLATAVGTLLDVGATVGLAHSGISTVGKSGEALKQATINATKDAANFFPNVVPATYHLADQAVHGDVKGVGHSLLDPYVNLFTHPKNLYDHPLDSYLLLAGVKGGLGRAAGKVGRSGLLGQAVKDASSMSRAPRVVPGTKLAQAQRWNPDVTVKLRQVAGEKAHRTRVAKLEQKARIAEARGDHETARDLQMKAMRTHPDRMKDHEIKRQLDELIDANEIHRRTNKVRVTKAVDKMMPSHGGEAVSVHAQAITHASADDLRAYRSELEREAKTLSGSELTANRQLRKQIGDAIKHADPAEMQRAARDFADFMEPINAKLEKYGFVDKEQAARRRVLPYAVRHMGLTHDPKTGFVDGTGRPVPTDEIVAHMREKMGPDFKPTYITQQPGMRGARNYMISQYEAPKMRLRQFTGRATRQGLFDAHPEVLRETAARAQGLIDAHEGFARFIDQFAKRDTKGEVIQAPTYDAVMRIANQYNDRPGATPVKPVRMNPFAGRSEQLESLIDFTHPDHVVGGAHEPLTQAIQHAVESNTGEGPWALVPTAAAERMSAHARIMGPGAGMKLMQLGSKAFRQTVLATNPRWLAGNLIEGLLRTVIQHGPGAPVTIPLAIARYYRVRGRLARVDPEAARELDARVLSGGHYGMVDRLPRRSADQFISTRLEPIAKALGAFWRTPGPKQLAGAWKAYSDFVFHTVNGHAEAVIQAAMAGKSMHTQLMDGHMLGLSEKAVEQAAEGLRGTPEIIALGRAVDDAYGRYRKFSPAGRTWLSLYTPFAAWMVSAFKFLVKVLPRDHPVLTSLMASANQATEEWRKEHGLDMFASGRVPGFLQGSIPLGGDAKQRFPNRYTPFALAGDPLGTLVDSLLPQFSGVIAAGRGQDWRGRPLKSADGGPPTPLDELQAAVTSGAESSIPVLGTALRIADKGPDQALNPFAVTKPKGGSSSGTSTVSPAIQRLQEDLAKQAQQVQVSPAIQKLQDDLARRLNSGRP